MLVSVGADDLLGEVGIAVHVVAPKGYGHGHAPLFFRHAETETLQDGAHLIVRDADAEQVVDLTIGRFDGLGFKALGVRIGAVTGRRAAAELLHEVERPVHGKRAGIGVDALFEARGGIGALPERAGSLAHAVARELRRLEEHRLGIRLDLAVQPAHDARKRDALLAVADEQVLGREGELLFVERDDLLARPRAAYDDPAARKIIAVERVHGLPEFEKNKVGDIHHVGDGAQPAKREAAAHPARRSADLHIRHVVPHIARAERGLFHRDGNAHVRFGSRVVRCGHFKRLFQDGGDFARHAEHALTIGAVGGDGDIEEIIVDADDRTDIHAHGGIFVEDEDAVHLRALVIIVGDAELLARAEHALAHDAAQLARFDLLDTSLVQDGRAVERAGHDRALKDVGRRRADLFDPVRAAVHRADGEPVRIGMLFRLCDAPRDDVRHVLSEIGEALHLEPAGKEFFLQFFGRNIDVHIVF